MFPFANWHSIRSAWKSMLSFSLSCKTAFHQACLTKHVLFQLVFAKRHFTRHTWQRWQNMFSFSLFLEDGISPGILDNACSLSAKRISPGILDKAWKGLGRVWEGSGKGLGRVWEGSGKGLGMLKMKHEKRVGCFMAHKSEVGRAWGLKMVPKSVVGAPSHPTLRNHEKHPNPFSCFMSSLPKPFPPHSWEPWSTQTPFHASFLAFHEAWSIKRGLGASWFPRVGWEGLGKAQSEA